MNKTSIFEKIERAIRKWRVRQCRAPFVIWFRERSGSTHLCSLLDQHPQVKCRKEDFHELFMEECETADLEPLATLGNGRAFTRGMLTFGHNRIENPTSRQVVAHLYDVFSFPLAAAGFKFKFPLQTTLFPEIERELLTLGAKLRLIVLSRQNFLKQAVSNQNLQRMRPSLEGGANLSARQEEDGLRFPPLTLDIPRALRYARRLKLDHHKFMESAREFEIASGCQLIHVNYEELFVSQEQTMERLFHFLSVDSKHRVESQIRKSTPDDLSQAIANYQEVEDAVRNTEFWEMLREGRQST